MPTPKPIDLLVACRSCKAENFIGRYTPELPAVCSQCRERLIDMELMESHKEVVCGDCGMTMLLFNDTEITPGQSNCRCGSTNLFLQDSPSIPMLAQEANAFGNSKDGDPVEDDFDWCRSSSDEEASEDYNEIFDKDPGI